MVPEKVDNLVEDFIDFDTDVSLWANTVANFIVKWYGIRCTDYDENCICCQKWDSYDDLVHNPMRVE